MPKVILYSTTYCPYCRAAKNLLRDKKIAFEERDVTDDSEAREWLKKTTGQMTVPQIFINDKPIGGYQELVELDQEGKLSKYLS